VAPKMNAMSKKHVSLAFTSYLYTTVPNIRKKTNTQDSNIFNRLQHFLTDCNIVIRLQHFYQVATFLTDCNFFLVATFLTDCNFFLVATFLSGCNTFNRVASFYQVATFLTGCNIFFRLQHFFQVATFYVNLKMCPAMYLVASCLQKHLLIFNV
jgi:hypothetical protein